MSESLRLPVDYDRFSEVFGHRRRPSQDFQNQTKRDAQAQVAKELEKLLHTCPSGIRETTEKDFEGFEKLFGRFINESGPSVEWSKIEKLPEGSVRNYSGLSGSAVTSVKEKLEKLVVVKLNGGLGTSMGCTGPKSIIPVRSDLTFLDLTVQQIEALNKKYDCQVPLVLMNSYNTEEDTQKVIRKYHGFQVKTYTFNQSRYPRIQKESLMPIPQSCIREADPEGWYPPGHGDFYLSFLNSGLLQEFLNQGKEYVFVSNIDNLGATVDLNILTFLMGGGTRGHCEFLMEVTDKTRADVKGGTLIQYEDKLRLLEIAQVPKEHVDDFKSVKTFKIFNTNNLWIKLDAMARVLAEGTMDMEVIINNKTLKNGRNIIQLEQAVGAAIKCFNGALGINVPRSRFLPVKKTEDLLLVMSNLYSLQQGMLLMSPRRQFDTTPLVRLGGPHFGSVVDFLRRFASIPDLLELDHLSVSGDVTFGRRVVLKGTVIIIANHGDRIDIPSGSVLENKIISGNLRILDH
ncbi:UTP--glucose-1-phosphate uridylyltransferase-like [Penaeus japonicus]|uniref:UTP--glucose-1-phosphate uridylyltransferase-like n=1 Tax=Penaeus japonicus TaxID=27405 RepID=UPI001C70C52E|nr:UTP--glucose-1-phosphate uridylyltransferase-like [Penaeus japonicus]